MSNRRASAGVHRVANHRLIDDDGQPVEFRRSPNQSRGAIEPQYLVMHYTAGASASSSVRWLCDKQAKASAHLVIGRDGGVTQLVDFNRKAWHAGRSRWNGREGVNGFSIGIELANSGPLTGGAGRWRTAFGSRVDDENVIVAVHPNDGVERGWERYTEAQLGRVRDVASALVDEYGLKEIVGHEDVAPGRKTDPGPAFPMASFRAIVEGRKEDSGPVFRTTAALNIRTGPGTEFAKLDVSPMRKGTRLDVLAAQGIWRQVDVLDVVNDEMDVVGWVHSRFITTV
jgi:N-acetylmuramoyl-L-alanine amidase